MSLKTVTIKIKPWKKSLSDAAKVMKALKAGRKVRPTKDQYFDSLDAVRSVLTEKRLELLYMVNKYRPKSVKELARLVARDFKQVYDDVKRLTDFGLIKSVQSKKGVATELRSKANKINVQIAI